MFEVTGLYALPTLLATIPWMLGERPRDRIVVLPLGARPGIEAYSHTLPWRGDARNTRRVAKDLAMTAVEMGGVHSILIAVFCRSPAAVGDRPYEKLQYLVAEVAHQHRIHLAEAFYVAANGWGSFCCDDPRCELAGPRPLAELERWADSMGMSF